MNRLNVAAAGASLCAAILLVAGCGGKPGGAGAVQRSNMQMMSGQERQNYQEAMKARGAQQRGMVPGMPPHGGPAMPPHGGPAMPQGGPAGLPPGPR